MTRLPHENRQVKGRNDFPSYDIGGQCGAPWCREVGNEAHHIWRRSFLSGAYDWVELWDGTIVGNKVGLCNRHHRDITENAAQIVYEDGLFMWHEGDGEFGSWFKLQVQPPLGGSEKAPNAKESHNELGVRVGGTRRLEPLTALPGSDSDWVPLEECPKCNGSGRVKPKVEKKELEPAKKRQTLSIRCPKEREEDGVELLLDMLAQGEEILRPGEKARPMYFTLADMLGLFLLHKENILSDG